MKHAALAVLLALCVGSCVAPSRSEWTPLPRSAERFDQVWAAPILGDEYARLGVLGLSMGESYGAWTVISFIEASDGTDLRSRVRGGGRIAQLRSACDARS